MMKPWLNIGCGELTYLGYDTVNVDLRRTSIVHVIADAGRRLPFRDCSFHGIIAMDIIEHLDDVVKVMDEFHRVTIPGGLLKLRTTHYRSEQSFADPTHRHWFTLQSFDFFDPFTDFGSRYGHYTSRKWRVLVRQVCDSELVFELRKMISLWQ